MGRRFGSLKSQKFDACSVQLAGLKLRLSPGLQVAYILTVGVLPSHRKQGLASSLIQKVFRMARIQGQLQSFSHHPCKSAC